MEEEKQGKMWSHDALRINLDNPADVEFWTSDLRCTKAELLDAMNKVGSSASAVRLFLRFR